MTPNLVPAGPVESWPIVTCEGVSWYVAPTYLAPVSRSELDGLCAEWGCEIPSCALVDAIWQAADLKLNPHALRRDYRFTKELLAFGPQARAIEAEIKRVLALAGRETFTLMAGSHKDFARLPGGRVDLYGWHSLAGVPIEKGETSHDKNYKDYSQGWRPVRRAPDTRGCELETVA